MIEKTIFFYKKLHKNPSNVHFCKRNKTHENAHKLYELKRSTTDYSSSRLDGQICAAQTIYTTRLNRSKLTVEYFIV